MKNFDSFVERGARHQLQQAQQSQLSRLLDAELNYADDQDAFVGPSHLALDVENYHGKFKTLFQDLPLYQGFQAAVDSLFNRMVVHGVCDMSDFFGADDPIVGYALVHDSTITQTYQELYDAAFKKYRQQFPRNESPSTLRQALQQGQLANLSFYDI